MKRNIKTYSELISIPSFTERLEYLKEYSKIGVDTFGHDRYLNQKFYRSKEWKDLRNFVISRDNACDLGVPGYEIHHNILIHHMNPLTIDDINNNIDLILDPNYLITTCLETHNAIHYGNEIVNREPIIRTPNDTCPWKVKI